MDNEMDNDTFQFPENEARYLKGAINTLMGMELLEYENKGLLSGDTRSRSAVRRDILLQCTKILVRVPL